MKKMLYALIVYGVIMCGVAMVAGWMLFDYRAAGLTFSAILGVIGIFTAFESLDRLNCDEGEEDDK